MKKPSTSFSLASRSASVHGGHVGRAPAAPCAATAGRLAEQRRLARLALLLQELGLAQRRLERLDELLAVPAERVAGAGGDQRLEHPLVAEPEVDPLDEVDERGEGRVLPAPR